MSPDPMLSDWPEDGLERVERCPLCNVSERSLLYTDQTDRVFRVASGSWSLWNCGGCGAAYLDPRPNQATIGMAYTQYYTHAAPENARARTLIAWLRRIIGNTYRNKRFGTDLHPTILLGQMAIQLNPTKRRLIDTQCRFLPGPHSPTGPRHLLDVGCGSGSFLAFAKSAGWSVAGVEPDPNARAIASRTGADIRPRLEDWTSSGEYFDYVTTSHVIEHVHNPIGFLRSIYHVLRQDCKLFVDTPNIRSVGHLLFKDNWRDLDPPRHLVLFNSANLETTLRVAGFVDVEFHPRPEVFPQNAVESARIQRGLDPFCDEAIDVPSAPTSLTKADLMIDRAEFLTVTARKP